MKAVIDEIDLDDVAEAFLGTLLAGMLLMVVMRMTMGGRRRRRMF